MFGYIFIVDDYDENLQVLGNTLIDGGYDVSSASNGEEALEILFEESEMPDLILLDVMMPKLNGYETCKKLKENPKTKDIPIIFLTAKTESENIVEGFDVGGVDYITKPFSQKELLARVKNHIELKISKEKIIEMNKELALKNFLIEQDLSVARNYIESIIPPPLSSDNISADWKFIPSEYLGGDIFNYFFLDDEHFVFYVLDVSGHGIQPALLSVSISNILRYKTLPDVDFHRPADVLNKLNKIFDITSNNGLFFTMWYGVYNINSRKLDYSSGGHPPAFHFQEGKFIDEYYTRSPLIGGMPLAKFIEKSIILPENSELFLYTDGSYEIEYEKNKMASFDYLKEFLMKNHQEENILDYLYNHLLLVTNRPKLKDDFTIVKFIFK